jgi:hypothetical protein
MVDIKAAVAMAVQFAQTVLDPARTTDIRLEEVEIGEHRIGEHESQDVWRITLSMGPPQTAITSVLSGRAPREYKTFMVRKETREVLAMKIRELAGTYCSTLLA